MFDKRWVFKETNLFIKADSRAAISAAIDAALEARKTIERFIVRCPEFRYSLEPLYLRGDGYPKVIRLMLRASQIADVGPFAAVAGAISQIAMEAALDARAKNILVENGGDISLAGNRNFVVGIYAGDSKISGKLGFMLQKSDLPAGVCTSSGTVGHSISFGEADAVTVVADEASIADAAATSIANEVRGPDLERSIKCGLDRADDIEQIRGCLIARGAYVGTTGKLPKLVQTSEPSVSELLNWLE